MTRQFGDHSRSVAFNLTLSKAMCNAMLRAASSPKDACQMHSMRTLRDLESRGLVFWHPDVIGRVEGFGGVTVEGNLVVGLLTAAGMNIENTNSISVIKRMEESNG